MSHGVHDAGAILFVVEQRDPHLLLHNTAYQGSDRHNIVTFCCTPRVCYPFGPLLHPYFIHKKTPAGLADVFARLLLSRGGYFSSSITGARGAGCASKARLAAITRRCCITSPGLPMVAPRLRRVTSARGGATPTVLPAFQLVITVAIPANSRARAISPTDCVQSGHDGTKKAASTRKSRAPCTI